MTILKAQELAKAYAQAQGEIIPSEGLYYSIKDGEEYSDCFYFDYLIVDSNGNIPNENPMISGSPGVIVDKNTGKVENISFGKLNKLKRLNIK